jgi:hypothetical protein
MASTLTIGANSGVIKEIGSDLSIVQGAVGLRINDAGSALSPTTASANNDATVDLGVSNVRFKDLYLSGNAYVGGIRTPTSGTSNFRAGVNAGNSIVSGGNYNTVVGDEAGTAITTGDYNVAVGYDALTVDTLGANSVAIGAFALRDQNFTSATNAYNVGVGYEAGGSITTGVNNTLIGGLAGDAITTANSNTAVGYASLTTATTGANNAAFGVNALTANYHRWFKLCDGLSGFTVKHHG